jgi:F-type H+-transporting ATPase subunit delta
MSELATLARPYAEAVFKRAKETGKADNWSEMLLFIATVTKDKELSVFIDNPNVSKDDLTRLMLDICQEQITAEGVNFLKLLIQNDRLPLVPLIATLYEQYRSADEGYVDANVLTAYACSKEEQKQLASSLEKMLNKKVRLNMDIDKSLIGGVVVRAGDLVIDGSIRGQLQQLAKRL